MHPATNVVHVLVMGVAGEVWGDFWHCFTKNGKLNFVEILLIFRHYVVTVTNLICASDPFV